MNKSEIIQETTLFIKEKFTGEGSGHDWWHIFRVRNIAMAICTKENADAFIVELGALLHDIADWKFYEGDINAGSLKAREWLLSLDVDESVILMVCEIINDISFKGAGVKTGMKTLEGKIVQDADRLDAIGAIGIARTFAYGGFKGREMYNPEIKPEIHLTFEQYKKSTGPTINHFYEKLLLLKDSMNTTTAKVMAESRHMFMEKYLEQFYREWDAEQ